MSDLLQPPAYPAWLDDFIAIHPQVIDRVLGDEISWMLAQPAAQHGHSVMLQNVHHADPRLGRLFLPRLRIWLSPSRGSHGMAMILAPPGRLEQVVEIFRKLGDDSDKETIARLGDAALISTLRG